MSTMKASAEAELATARFALDAIEHELRQERQLHYAVLADHQAAVRRKDRQIEQLERRLRAIHGTKWWRLRRWLVQTLSRLWWVEDHVD